MPSTNQSDEQLAELLAVLLEQSRNGLQPDFDVLRTEHPEHAAELQQLWATAMVAEDLVQLSEAVDASETNLIKNSGRFVEPITPTLPRVMGDYQLLEELGRGGMGIVYRAQQLSLRRIVAVKMLLRGEMATEADFARFQVEAAAVAKLEHSNIVKVYEVGESNGQPFFSMQYIEGPDLASRLREGPLPPREAARILVPVCRAIAEAHRCGVLHRDLKPSNILLDQQETPYVTDFGLAKRFDAELLGLSANAAGERITHTGAILGTPGYMAPEQAIGTRGKVSPATDIYSLGAILYAMLTGRAPFQAASPVDVLLMVLEEEPPAPRVLNRTADPDLEMIALKSLQKPSDLRYDTADDLADDLLAYLSGDPISARSSHFTQIISRAFRDTHHAGVLENWGLLWIWHAVVLLVLSLVTNFVLWQGVTSRWPYLVLWTLGLGTWAAIFWNLRRRAGPVTFVERQIAHVWAGSMACSTMLYALEAMLNLEVLKLSPVLPLIAGSVFLVKAGILSGEFYIQAVVLFATSILMAAFPAIGLTIFGFVSAACFLIPGLRFYRQRKASTS